MNCKAGIEVGTEKAWELCEEYNLPRIIFVTNMDDDQASFRELILKLEKRSEERSLRSRFRSVRMKSS